MSSTKSSPKRIAKASSDNGAISFDLLSSLTYMAALADGNPSRDILLRMTISQNYQTGVYFRQVFLLAKRMGFEYTRAFRMVARKAGASTVKNHLLRFAGAITAGVSESEFLAQEARVEREQYINNYYRSLEALAKWGDAYAALLVSISLVVVVAMISTMLSDLGNMFVMALTGATFCVSFFGVYIIYRTAPTEDKNYQNRRGPKLRRMAKRAFFTLVPLGAVLGTFVGLAFGIPYFLLVMGVALFPSGVFAWMENSKLNNLDQEAATFIRSLGNVTASLSSTLSAALVKIDRRALGTLNPYLKRLQVLLDRKISPEKAWDAFRDEVGSQLMNRSTRMFVDGVALGGSPERVGEIASAYAMDTALMRDRRVVTAAPFAFLIIPLHFAMTGLTVFVMEIMQAFNDRISVAAEQLAAQSGGSGLGIAQTLPVFRGQDLTMMGYLSVATLLSMTISNALAPKVALGGHPLNAALFGSITCLMTGFNMLIIPPIASSILLSGS